MKRILLLLIPVLVFSYGEIKAQVQTLGHPSHVFFEFGPLGSIENGSATKNGSHFAAGFKKHSWLENRPIQFELDLNYRGISFYDSLDVKHSVKLGECYLGPRIMISKTSPLYPTFSILGGGYLNFSGIDGLGALATLGIYYNLTDPGQPRNGMTFEISYHTSKIMSEGYTIPPAVALRIGFFF